MIRPKWTVAILLMSFGLTWGCSSQDTKEIRARRQRRTHRQQTHGGRLLQEGHGTPGRPGESGRRPQGG